MRISSSDPFGSGDREDPEKGPAYVDTEYPRRAAYCLPIIIYPPDAYDVSKRATPEMVAAGKPPGTNEAKALLRGTARVGRRRWLPRTWSFAFHVSWDFKG